MGVTIYYGGRTNLETAKEVVNFVVGFAKAFKMEYETYETEDSFGVIINFNELIRTESFVVGFRRDGDDWVIRGFCKTQVFNDSEIYNLYAHIVIDTILMTMKHTWIPDLEIFDEGDFYFPLDPSEKQRLIEEHIAEEYWDEYWNKKPFNFKELVKAHGQNLALICKVAEAFKNMGANCSIGVRLGGDQTKLQSDGQTKLHTFDEKQRKLDEFVD